MNRGLFRYMEHMIRCNMCECVVYVFGRAWRGYVYIFERGADRGGVCAMRDR